MTGFRKNILMAGIAVLFACACTTEEPVRKSEQYPIVSFPVELDANCRSGRAKIYDECSDQLELFKSAKLRAEQDGKVLLVSYGAEWCIWCHVFEAYIHGETDKFKYTFGEAGNDERYTHTFRERAKRDVEGEAEALTKFVSENFVLVHIDYEHSPDGDDVLTHSDAWENFSGGVPYIYTVDAEGKFAAKFNHDDAEVRRDTDDWYRGYDRVQLLEQLTSMRDVAIRQSAKGN